MLVVITDENLQSKENHQCTVAVYHYFFGSWFLIVISLVCSALYKLGMSLC